MILVLTPISQFWHEGLVCSKPHSCQTCEQVHDCAIVITVAYIYTVSLFLSPAVKGFWKLDNSWQRYEQIISWAVFWLTISQRHYLNIRITYRKNSHSTNEHVHVHWQHSNDHFFKSIRLWQLSVILQCLFLSIVSELAKTFHILAENITSSISQMSLCLVPCVYIIQSFTDSMSSLYSTRPNCPNVLFINTESTWSDPYNSLPLYTHPHISLISHFSSI